MKVKAHAVKTLNIKYKDKNYDIKICKDIIEFTDGYAIIMFNIDKYGPLYVIINNNFELVTPVVEITDEKNSDFLSLYENKKAIYGVKGELYYLIDLSKTKFQKKLNMFLPEKYMQTFENYMDINNNNILIYNNEKYFVFDVANNKVLSSNYDYIDLSKTDKDELELFLDVYESEQGYVTVKFYSDLDGNLKNNVEINGIEAWFCDDLLKDNDALKQNIYETYIKMPKGDDAKWGIEQ